MSAVQKYDSMYYNNKTLSVLGLLFSIVKSVSLVYDYKITKNISFRISLSEVIFMIVNTVILAFCCGNGGLRGRD